MKGLFSDASRVPLGRVLREHRRRLTPLAAILGINIGLLVLVVLPLSAAVAASQQRAAAAAADLAAATAEHGAAEALRDGQAQASTDLDLFYREVLPTSVANARRITHVRLAQLARQHNVDYERMSASPESIRDSSLERLQVSMTLSGDYEDIRAFLYDLETASEFVVIDNMVLAEGREQNEPLALSLELSTYYRPQAGDNAR